MNPANIENIENGEVDLVVVGGGGAGISAALTANEKGIKNIIVLEKGNSPGGNTALSTGIFAVDSPVQRRDAVDASGDSYFKVSMIHAHWKSNPQLVRAYINKTGDTIGWLENKGLKFSLCALYFGQSPLVWHVPDGEGSNMMRVLVQKSTEAGIKILTGVKGMKLLKDDTGKLVGIVAATGEGQEFNIPTRCVVIAAGGYGANKELMAKNCPQYYDGLVYDGVPANTGEGLIMATEFGAATQGLGLLLIFGPRAWERISIRFPEMSEAKQVALTAIAKEPNTLYVNKKGRRFIDEVAGADHSAGGAIVQQPDHFCYTVIDQKIVETMTAGVYNGQGPYRVVERMGMPGMKEELAALAKKGTLMMSDSWDEIANWIGARPEVLKATVDEYNAACDKGYDSIFNKDPRFLQALQTPPYYAIRGISTIGDTLGGIKVNEHMEALDNEDEIIPGLYAAGSSAGGLEADSYCPILSGSGAGFAINSGRIAGESAARFILGEKTDCFHS